MGKALLTGQSTAELSKNVQHLVLLCKLCSGVLRCLTMSNNKHTIIFAGGFGCSSKLINETPFHYHAGKDNVRIKSVRFSNPLLTSRFSIKSSDTVAKKVVNSVLKEKKAKGENFDGQDITLYGICRGAYAVHRAAAELKAKHNISVNAVIQGTPMVSAGDFIATVEQRTFRKGRKKSKILEKTVNALTDGGYKMREKDRDILKSMGKSPAVPVYQFVGDEDKMIDTKGLLHNARFANKVIFQPLIHGEISTYSQVKPIVNKSIPVGKR